jgi:hypothetical protein
MGARFTALVVQREPEMSVILYQRDEGGSSVNFNELILAEVFEKLAGLPLTENIWCTWSITAAGK